MGEILNLGRARKRLARAEDAERAAENRVRFGRTAAEKQRVARARAVHEAALDGKQCEEPPEAG